MTGDPHKTPSSRTGEMLQTAAFVLLIACIAARPFLQEMTFRLSPLPKAVFNEKLRDNKDISTWQIERMELSRVTFAMLLLAAATIWLVGAAMKKQGFRHLLLAALIIAFAAWAYLCTLHASDRRSAMDAWLEQVSLLAALWLAAQMFADRQRFALLIILLAGVGAALAYKGIFQVTAELPETIRHFEIYGDSRYEPGSSQTKMFESRLRALTPTGFFALSNMYASAIIILLAAAAGLATDKFIAAKRSRRQFMATRKKGEIHLPTMAALLSAAVVPALLAVLLLSRSRGGIVAGILAIAAFVCVGIWRESLAKHWRKAVAAAAAVFLLAVAATVAYGLKTDRLPTTTMTFRWYYWTGSADIVRENPLWGAGPGNFHTAYLLHRRPEAEEAVRLPHNVIAHAAAQFGLPGGTLYLLILAGVLVGICRPKTGRPPDSLERQQAPHTLPLIIFMVLATFAAMMTFSNIRGNGIAAMVNSVPAFVLLVGLLAAAWAGGKFSKQPSAAGDMSRIALACGLGGFVLHNMVEFSIWTPGTALLFWASAGACLAQGYRDRPAEPKIFKFIRWPAAVCALAGFVLLLAFAYVPVAARFTDMEEAAEAAKVGDFAMAMRHSSAAAKADELDPITAADTARLAIMVPSFDKRTRDSLLRLGLDYAGIAIARDPADADNYMLAAKIAERIAPGSELQYLADAISCDPQSMQNRLEYAERLAAAGRKAECLAQLDAIERIDAALLPESLQHLTSEEKDKIKNLRNDKPPASP